MATDSIKISKLLQETKNSCTAEHAVTHGFCSEPNCGDELRIYFNTTREIISAIGFTINESACDVAKACACAAIKNAKDQPVMAAYLLDYNQISEELGNLNKEHIHCAMMAEIALKQAIINYSKLKRREQENE